MGKVKESLKERVTRKGFSKKKDTLSYGIAQLYMKKDESSDEEPQDKGGEEDRGLDVCVRVGGGGWGGCGGGGAALRCVWGGLRPA